MFRMVFIAVCALPLILFTGMVALNQVSGNNGGTEPPKGNGNGGNATRAAAVILKRANADLQMMEVLIDFDPLDADGTNNQPDLTKVTPSERFVATKNESDKLKPARHSIQSYIDLFPLDAEEELEALKAYLKNAPLKELAGARQLSRGISARIKTLEDQIRCKEQFAKAIKAFEAGQFAKCLEIISEIPLDAADEETKEKITLLENVAKFELYWKAHVPQSVNLEAEAALLARLLGNEEMPDPPNEKARRKLNRKRERLTSLEGKIAVGVWFQGEHNDVAEFAKSGSDLAQVYPKEAREVSDKFSKWLKRRIKPKDVPVAVKEFGEAETPKGAIISGIFIAIDEKKTIFKYWKTAAARNAGVAFVTKYLKTDLTTRPGPPKDVAMLKEYKTAFDHLQNERNLSAQHRRWEDFAKLCEKNNKKMQQYALKKGQETPTVTFDAEAKQARAVLDAWDDVEDILRKGSTRRGGFQKKP